MKPPLDLAVLVGRGHTIREIASLLDIGYYAARERIARAGLRATREITAKHGNLRRYSDHGCRCPACCEAKRNAGRSQKERRLALTAANGGVAPVSKHNLSTYSNWGCRCAECRAARAAA